MIINLQDHLSDEDMKRIAEDEFRSAIRLKLKDEQGIKRTISNAAYEVVWKSMDEFLNEDSRKLMKESIDKVLSDITYFNVFKKPDVWDKETNAMYDYLQECITSKKGEVKNIVEDTLQKQVPEFVESELKAELHEIMVEAVARKIGLEL